MVKTITKVGNSNGIILDAALMALAHLKAGDQLNVEIHDGGAITFTPLRGSIEADPAGTTAKRLIDKNSELFRRLS
jgi:antitoxin component of MazEF toxin-antitoxin module